MSIEKVTFPYEVLIRLGPKGYQGSHVVDCTRVVEGDTVHAETLGDARAVTLAECGALLGEQVADLIEQVERECARADTAELDQGRIRHAAQEEIDELRAAHRSAQIERDDALATLDGVRHLVALAPQEG